ncbi:MAG TPA: 4'-phosphopantetheinyl transferase superfamily protein [Candidatus Binataceae bacterium]|nr:4'-phosphopantetheinyl transferase superfamily protein [Candidatus Binataceae bacterium]
MTIASSTTVAHPSWRLPGDTLILGNDEVHVWRAALNCDPSQIDNFLHSLADNEQVRAERFYFAMDRERFIVAHGVLREILGRYLNRAAQSVSFRYGSHGKPALAEESDGNAIHFNMSHSRGVALYAVTRGREIGVDLEFIREDLEVEQLAERFFSRSEAATLRALPASLRKYAFFLCWTRKEAYIKARGQGLSLPLDQFDVSLTPGEPAALLRTQADPDEALRWSLQDLSVDPGYMSALAVERDGWSLCCWQWPRLPQSTAWTP